MMRALPRRVAAPLALAAIVAGLGAGFLPVLAMGLEQGLAGFDPYAGRVLRFTLLQAGLSTAISLATGIPLARALARQRFAGRNVVLRLLALPQALPSIVVIIGIIEIYGTQGWLGGAFDIYGLQGILLAHVLFNFPFAARLALSQLEAIPQENWKLAAQLGFTDRQIWRLVEWPQLKSSLPGMALLIFLLCAASFAIVLTLGGGPRATTLEVAIYQALRADFDPARAASLALVQLLLCAGLAAVAQRWGGMVFTAPVLGLQVQRFDGRGTAARRIDLGVIAFGLLVLVPPLAAIAAAGLLHLRASPALWNAALTSILLGAAAALVGLTAVWPLASAAARSRGWRRIAAVLVLAGWIVPPAVLATGWFIVLSRHADVMGLAPLLVIVMNGLMALPFAYQILAPAVAEAAARHDRLCAGLGITGWTRLRLVDLPAVRKPLGLAATFAFVVSLGDLTAISLFGTQDLVTLPSLIYRQMGSYRIDEAVGTALLLGLLVLGLMSLAERWSAADDRA